MDDLVKRLIKAPADGLGTENLCIEAADRIEQLEEKLLSATMDGYDIAKHEYRDRIEALEAKLENAVETLEYYNVAGYEGKEARTTLAELKGQNDGTM